MHTTLHSLLLAQVIGFYLVVMAIAMLARADYYQPLIKNTKSPGLPILVIAAFSLIIGTFLVLTHNIWTWNFELLITLIGWLIVIKSIFWLIFPEKMLSLALCCYQGWGYYTAAVISGIIGLIFLAHGVHLYF